MSAQVKHVSASNVPETRAQKSGKKVRLRAERPRLVTDTCQCMLLTAYALREAAVKQQYWLVVSV
jgi:hypothetical protein